MDFRQNSTDPSELVIGLIGPVGCNRKLVVDTITSLAKHYSYTTIPVHLSDAVAPYVSVPDHNGDEYTRVTNLMKAGNELRLKTLDKAIFAKFAAMQIRKARAANKNKKIIYLIDSLKRPEEVEELRNIYGDGFFLFAIHSSETSRNEFLKNQCLIFDASKRQDLIDRDKDEKIGHGQATSEAFHLADFFLTEEGSSEKIWNTMERFFDIIFGDPFKTPTFSEYAMFMAYAASIKSADMSRQVGAVITTGDEILSTGANECPKPAGGTYWPIFSEDNYRISDVPNGRDYMNGADRNGQEKNAIIEAIKAGLPPEIQKTLDDNIENSGLNDITEYGRVVHAEMDAILGCARRGVSCRDAVLFSTTYPCHNCAKHIIASGIKKVVFIEPYPKSKAFSMHYDALRTKDDKGDMHEHKVLFTPFIGVGPKRYVDLFSLSLSSGEKLRRKNKGGYQKAEWERSSARPRLKMFDTSYSRNEEIVEREAHSILAQMEKIII